MNKAVFIPLKQTQDATLRATKESDPFDVYGIKGFAQNNTELDGDYIVETELGSKKVGNLFSSSYKILASLSLYNIVLFVCKVTVDSIEYDVICTSNLESNTTPESSIFGDFNLSETDNISLCACDDNGTTKVFIADGRNPLRVIHLNKASLLIEDDNYIVVNDKNRSVKIKQQSFSSLKNGNTTITIKTGTPQLVTSADALDVLSVAYDYDRGVSVYPKETSSSAFKIGTYSIGLYEGIKGHPRSACIYDSEAIFLTSQTNKQNDVSNQGIKININKAYTFSKDYMSVVVKNNSTGEYKESQLFFLGRLPVSKNKKFTAFVENTINIIKASTTYTTFKLIVLYSTNGTTLNIKEVSSITTDTDILLSTTEDSFVYSCYLVSNINKRWDIPTSFVISFLLTNYEKVVPADKILSRDRTAIIPTQVSISKGRLLCCSKDYVDITQNGMNEIIGLVGSATSISDIGCSVEPDDLINRNPETIAKNSVALPFSTYMFGYQFRNKYGVWTDILTGDSAANMTKYVIPISLTDTNFRLSSNIYAFVYKGKFFVASTDPEWNFTESVSNNTGTISFDEAKNLFGISVYINNNAITIKDESASTLGLSSITVDTSGVPNVSVSGDNYNKTLTFTNI